MDKDIHSLELDIGEQLLPIGSVVLTSIVEQALMIYGRKQQQENNETVWDYVACPYPQGHISSKTNVFFNHDQIKQLIYKGLETEGEKFLSSKLAELDQS
ncbi:DUF4176 domain-containing protein [Amphibacillus cookii]|uniref:DUF4176 domain-containing protein n=1 Tax=Amphibacillus cookii TaxID=767787 RepID=UPI00195B8D5D|nr:DUF4176 domain-containing protein [Amphibacillus cookii]MBM7543017.1 hypothetical protein [Amphibacillus cookii]